MFYSTGRSFNKIQICADSKESTALDIPLDPTDTFETDVDGTLTELVVTAPNENPLDPVDFVTSGALLKLIEGVTVATDRVGVVVVTVTFVPKLKFTAGLGGVDNTTGFPIAADGDVMAVFLNPNASPSKLIGLDTAEAVVSCSGFVVTVVEVGEAI